MNDKDNLEMFTKGIKLPSIKGRPDEELKRKWVKQEQLGMTTIKVENLWELKVPDYAIEQAKEYFLSITRNQRRKRERDITKKITKFGNQLNSNSLTESELENSLEDMVQDVVESEALKQIRNEKVV